MKNLFTLVLFLATTVAFAQHKPTVHHFTFEKKAEVDFKNVEEDWAVHIQHLEAPGPGTSGMKAELRAKKARIAERFPATGSSRGFAKGGVPVPTVGVGFDPGPAQGTPNDNDVAIGNDKIVSCVNTRIRISDLNGDYFSSLTLYGFAQPLGLLGGKFDPKVIYDPIADRFVFLFMNGSTWETSHIVIGFSQTNDPEGDWNLYAIDGNSLDNETWSDYPVIGISNEELFIGINTFENGSTNNSGFVETCLWQIGLSEGYAGTDLNTAYYSDILEGTKEIFNICPIQGGLGTYGPEQYLLASRSFDEQNDTIFLLQITGNLANPNLELEVTTVTTPEEYFIPVTAPQPGGHQFDTNDNRVLGGFYQNETIQWVQATTDTVTGTAAILHGTITDIATNPTVSSQILSDPILHYGYPNISCTGAVEIDEQAIITFNFTGDSINPGMSAIYYTTAGDYSEMITLKEGFGPVNVLTSVEERWGDYSGTQLVYDDRGHIWAAGSYGKSSGSHGTWVTELFSPDQNLSVKPNIDIAKALVFPNPAVDYCNFEFWVDDYTNIDLKLFNANGQMVKLVYYGLAKPGKSRIQFSLDNLESGSYFLQGVTTKGLKFDQTVIVN
ncbi:MAG: hypothetical protein ACI9FU_002373 [Granulosicoccus sp.]|jgi:hypothetical protein